MEVGTVVLVLVIVGGNMETNGASKSCSASAVTPPWSDSMFCSRARIAAMHARWVSPHLSSANSEVGETEGGGLSGGGGCCLDGSSDRVGGSATAADGTVNDSDSDETEQEEEEKEDDEQEEEEEEDEEQDKGGEPRTALCKSRLGLDDTCEADDVFEAGRASTRMRRP